MHTDRELVADIPSPLAEGWICIQPLAASARTQQATEGAGSAPMRTQHALVGRVL